MLMVILLYIKKNSFFLEVNITFHYELYWFLLSVVAVVILLLENIFFGQFFNTAKICASFLNLYELYLLFLILPMLLMMQ